MKGMVIIENENYGECMELVKCAKKTIAELSELLSTAHMSNGYPEEDDYEEREHMRYGGRRSHVSPRGRYGY